MYLSVMVQFPAQGWRVEGLELSKMHTLGKQFYSGPHCL